jgi:hypothetical protein
VQQIDFNSWFLSSAANRVLNDWFVLQVEKRLESTGHKKSSARRRKTSPSEPGGGAPRPAAKASTLSLHAVPVRTTDTDSGDSGEDGGSLPPLQRRNSIHNVPYVDVNDPETRSRMERYKEERRSLLRARYKAEDYLSSDYSKKKKFSTGSSQVEGSILRNNADIKIRTI